MTLRTFASLLVLATAAGSAGAQEARFVLREAVFPDVQPVRADTAAMEQSTVDGKPIYLGRILLTLGKGAATSVSVAFDPYTVAPQVSLTLADKEAEAFASITGARIGQAIALVDDGRVLTAPTVQTRIPGGRLVIQGAFTQEETEALAAAIREATGARDGRDLELQELRASVDLTTPEGAASAFARATAVTDWLTVARTLHPAALRSLRDDAALSLTIDSGRVSFNPFRPDGSGPVAAVGEDAPADSQPGPSIRSVLGDRAAGDRMADYTDEEIVALLLAATGGLSLGRNESAVVGSLPTGEGAAEVVLSHGEPWSGEEQGYAYAFVLSVRRVGDEWRVLLPMASW
jgi:hypothetical protein